MDGAYTPADIISIIGGITAAAVAIAAAITSALVSVRTRREVAKNARRQIAAQSQANDKLDVLSVKTEQRAEQVTQTLGVIHELTNSNLAAVKASLAWANARIEVLEQLLTEMRERSKGPEEPASPRL